MKHESNLTIKGQVTIPKDIRDALGLVPGMRVRFEMDADGNAKIVKPDRSAEIERRKTDFFSRLQEAQAIFKANDTMAGTGMDGLAYQGWLRGDEFDE